MVTFTVGGLSVINAVAGAMSEHLPLICITGCPNSNDFGGDKILHHTIGEVDFSQELRLALDKLQAVHAHVNASPTSIHAQHMHALMLDHAAEQRFFAMLLSGA